MSDYPMSANDKGQVMIRLGPMSMRAYDISRQDPVRYVLASGFGPEALRRMADDIEAGRYFPEKP